MRILLVEGDPAVARLTLRILASGGYVADHTKSGETALQDITKTEYDLVILDLMLPDVDGLVSVLRLRESFESVTGWDVERLNRLDLA